MKDDYHINVSLVRDFFQPSWRLRTHPLTLNPSVWMTISMFFPFSGRHWHIYFTFLSMFWSVMQNILHSATQTLARIWQSSEDPFRMLPMSNCPFHCRPLLSAVCWVAPASTSLYSDAAIPSWKLGNENTGEYAYRRLLLSLRIQAFMSILGEDTDYACWQDFNFLTSIMSLRWTLVTMIQAK